MLFFSAGVNTLTAAADANVLYAEMAAVCAVVIGILWNRIVSASRKETGPQPFVRFLSVSLLFCIVDMIWGILASRTVNLGRVPYILSTYAFHAMAAVATFSWSRYVLCYIKHENNRPLNIVRYLLLSIQLGLLFYNIPSRRVFFMDETGAYVTGQLRPVLFVLQFAYFISGLLYTLAIFLIEKREEPKKHYATAVVFSSVQLLSGIFQLIFPDAPFYSIGLMISCITIYLFNISDERERAIIQAHEQHEGAYRNAIYADACGSYEVNLTRNEIIGSIYDYRDGVATPVMDDIPELGSPINYTLFINWWRENMLIGDGGEFDTVTDRAHLIDCCRKGELMQEVAYTSNALLGGEAFYRHMYFLYRDEQSGDCIALCVIHDLTEQRQRELVLQRQNYIVQRLSDEFSAICYVDLDKDSLYDFRSSHYEGTLNAPWRAAGRYTERNGEYAESLVIPEDRELYVRFMSPDNLIKTLTATPVSYLDYRMTLGGTLHYYRIKAIRDESYGAAPHAAILGFKCIDGELAQQEELRAAKERAEAANEAKSTFLFNMSHDIRTPMNAIIGFTDIAAKNADSPEKVKDSLGKVRLSSEHLLSLINDVLDMARIESGKLVIDETPFDIHSNVDMIVPIIQTTAEEKGVRFISEYRNITDYNIYCDYLHVNQIILNLLSNAVKYTKEGGEVRYIVEQIPDERADFATYRFIIRDTGIGMSREFLEHIFEAFSRERTTTKSGVAGTGLGMSIAKRLTELMGGTLTIESEQGVGTTAVCQLSFRKLGDAVGSAAETAENDSAAAALLDGKTVLLTEDNALNREIARSILEELGMNVEDAEDGTVAVEKFSAAPAGHYDFILMDIQMPYMDGYEATRTIRALDAPDAAAVPIIAMTANAFDTDRRKALDAGMNAHLAKPVDVTALVRTLCGFLK